MATCVEVSSAAYPQQSGDNEILPPEGKSLLPAFRNEAIQREALYWEHEGNAAVRVGDRKLVRQGRNGAWELYDLKADRTEQKNLASAYPDQVTELAAKWEMWAERAHVKPYAQEGGGKKKGKGKAKNQKNKNKV